MSVAPFLPMHVRLALVSFAFLTACSSSDFSVAGEDAAADTGSTTTDTGVAVEDTGGTDTATPSDVSSDAPPGACAPIDLGASTIYVDQRSTRASVGTADCPTKTIKEALEVLGTLTSGKHVIKVAGGSAGAPLTYDESAAVVLKANTTLSGDGPGRVVITGGGSCSGTPCIVVMEGNSALDGVKIDAGGSKVPIALGPAAFTSITISHSVVVGVKGTSTPAIYVKGNGAVELGPELVVEKNEGIGVYVDSIFSLHVAAPAGGGLDKFNENLAGIVMKGGFLNFDGGEVANNLTHGIVVSSPNGTENIAGLIAHDNGQYAVLIDGGANLKMRGSSLTKNGKFGLVFKYTTGVGANDLDLGKAGDAGKNIFRASGATNAIGGICLPVARLTKGQAQGDIWSTCPPTTSMLPAIDAACDSVTSYADVWFAGTTVPLEFGDCTAGT